jgi:hypothetical protein
MKKYLVLIIIIQLTIYLIFPLSAQQVSSKYFVIDLDNWKLINQSKSEYTPEMLLKEADYYYENEYKDVNTKMPSESETKIPITFVQNQEVGWSSNWAGNRRVYIQAESITESHPLLAHEISHLVLSSRSIDSFNEGLDNMK